MVYKMLPINIWADDIFLQMSPEQKLVFMYLIAGPQTSWCGIFKLSLANMGFHLNLRNNGAEAALNGFLKAYPNLARYDKETAEIALSIFPRSILLEVKATTLRRVEKDLKEVQSPSLLRFMVDNSKASIKAIFLSRFRQRNMEIINDIREKNELDQILAENRTDHAKGVENQEVISVLEIEVEIEEESIVQKPNFEQPSLDYSFEDFWEDYGYKKGKYKCKKKWEKLTSKDILEIKRTLSFYKSQTTTSIIPTDKWKPMRKLPLTYLNQKVWEDYPIDFELAKEVAPVNNSQPGNDTYYQKPARVFDPLAKRYIPEDNDYKADLTRFIKKKVS